MLSVGLLFSRSYFSMKKGTTLMVNGDNQTAQPTISTIYATILLKHSTFVCQIAQLEQLNNCSLKYKEMSAGGKVKAFSQVVDHYVQRFKLNRCITKGI